MKPLKTWVAQILAIEPDRTLDEIYHAMHCFYTKEQILTVWKPEEEEIEPDEDIEIFMEPEEK